MTCKRYSYKWPGLAKFTEALASHNNNPTATAKHFGVSKSTIYEWIKLNNLHPQTPETIQQNISENQGEDMSKTDQFVSDSASRVIPYAFEGREIHVIEADEIMMSDRQLGEALEYSQPASAISKLADRYADELDKHQTIVELTTVDGKRRSVRVWREQGITLLTMFSGQPKAKAFRQFAAQTLYNVRRQQPAPTLSGLPQWAEMLMQQMGGTVIEVRQQQAAQQQQIEQMQQTVAAMPTVAADEVLARLQAVDSLKTHLHDLVDAIVTHAREYPPSDAYAWQYSHYQRAWKAVHEWAIPKVKSKAEYRTTAQVLSAIRGAEMILSKMGVEAPPQPQQLTINLFEHQSA